MFCLDFFCKNCGRCSQHFQLKKVGFYTTNLLETYSKNINVKFIKIIK
jgi:hypothetical protein